MEFEGSPKTIIKKEPKMYADSLRLLLSCIKSMASFRLILFTIDYVGFLGGFKNIMACHDPLENQIQTPSWSSDPNQMIVVALG